jgi:hypothetical protein
MATQHLVVVDQWNATREYGFDEHSAGGKTILARVV